MIPNQADIKKRYVRTVRCKAKSFVLVSDGQFCMESRRLFQPSALLPEWTKPLRGCRCRDNDAGWPTLSAKEFLNVAEIGTNLKQFDFIYIIPGIKSDETFDKNDVSATYTEAEKAALLDYLDYGGRIFIQCEIPVS